MEEIRKRVLELFTKLETKGIYTESNYRRMVEETNSEEFVKWMEIRLKHILKGE